MIDITVFLTSKTTNREPDYLSRSMSSMLNSFKFVHADERQGNIGRFSPYNFTRIFAKELSDHRNIAIITRFKAWRRGVEVHKSATKRDIPDGGFVVKISQAQYTCLIAIDPFVMPMFCHGTPRSIVFSRASLGRRSI